MTWTTLATLIFLSLLGSVPLAYPLWKLKLRACAEKLALVLAIFGVPISALLLYLFLGNPSMPDFPLNLRLDGPLEKLPSPAIIAKLEQNLMRKPNDLEGWRLLARIRARQNAPAFALEAWQNILYFEPDDQEAILGQLTAQINLDNGVVSAKAQQLISNAAQLAPNNHLVLYYQGLLAAQENNIKAARTYWFKSRSKAQGNSSWQSFIEQQIRAFETGSKLINPAAR